MPPRKKARKQDSGNVGPKTRSGSSRTAEVTLPGATQGSETDWTNALGLPQGYIFSNFVCFGVKT